MEDGDEDANEERVCLALQSDASSAFQTISRAAVLKAVHKYAPRLVPFVRSSTARTAGWSGAAAGPATRPA
jgi:hypothetical protein